MGAGRTTTGTVIGGLLAMYGSTIYVGAANSTEDMALGNGSALANGHDGSELVSTPAKVLLASATSTNSLNIEEISHDIIREEMAGDSPRHSGSWTTFGHSSGSSSPCLRTRTVC